jgi:tRNA (cmo5U34)-methyltransferase
VTRDNATPFRAAEYDAQVRKAIPYYEMLHDQTIDLVRAARPDAALWLDTGCGTGALVEKALPLFLKTQFLVADPSEAMLEGARARLANAAGRVSFVGALPSETLPGRLTEAPDVITAIQCHHYHKPDGRGAATKACYDILAPGGLYVTFENTRPLSGEGTRIGIERWKAYQLSRGRTPEEADAHLARFDREYFPITVLEHIGLLRKCGFRTVELFWFAMMQAGFYAIK